ncbi:protein of unknown function [Brochothrix thermosphacta]|nr:protein of unknown function [Brochothrix thermosphacta]
MTVYRDIHDSLKICYKENKGQINLISYFSTFYVQFRRYCNLLQQEQLEQLAISN